MSERWATFDCYGTLIDWNRGIGDALERMWPDAGRDRLLEAYHRAERTVQQGRTIPYRQVLTETARRVADALELPPRDGSELPESLPSWPPFPDVAAALETIRAAGWRTAILSNCDPDLLAASIERIGFPFDGAVTVAESGSYKPAPGHWRSFFAAHPIDKGSHVHVAASLFHDIVPCASMGLRAVWINRLGEDGGAAPRLADLPDLSGLPDVLAGL